MSCFCLPSLWFFSPWPWYCVTWGKVLYWKLYNITNISWFFLQNVYLRAHIAAKTKTGKTRIVTRIVIITRDSLAGGDKYIQEARYFMFYCTYGHLKLWLWLWLNKKHSDGLYVCIFFTLYMCLYVHMHVYKYLYISVYVCL